MIINNVTITNFFCYLNQNNFEFSRGLNIISAENSGGKSQLFNAFYWVFFNQIYTNIGENSTKKRWKKANELNLFPDYYSVNSKEGDIIETIVEIKITAPDFKEKKSNIDNVVYKFIKTIKYIKEQDKIRTYIGPELLVEYNIEGETFFIPEYNIEDVLNIIFPNKIRKFMWYQGETMENLYDFSNNKTLRDAIEGISYFPIYQNLEKVVKKSFKDIDNQIIKKLNSEKRIDKKQQEVLADISELDRKIGDKEKSIIDYDKQISDIEDDINEIEAKLTGFDHFLEYKTKLAQYEADDKLAQNRLNDIEHSTKNNLISKWMLNGCEDTIESSALNLGIIQKEIQTKNQTTNPVPFNLPGPEYVEKMLEDNVCYICERLVEEGTAAYEALKKRVYDFEQNHNNRILNDNFTVLNRAKKRLLSDLPSINTEIKELQKRKDKLLKERISISRKIANLFTEIGSENRSQIEKGAASAQHLTSKLSSYRSEVKTKTRWRQDAINSLRDLKTDLRDKKELKTKLFANHVKGDEMVEEVTKNYIELFNYAIERLKTIAYDKLIVQLEVESNRLYSKYLGNKEQGKVCFTNDGIRINDKLTNQFLDNLNTGEEVAEKLAVANSFLSLSAKKLGRSYPLIADAPTSDLDANNTYSLTVHLSGSFEQMIIMSKDYAQLNEKEKSELKADANISKYYEIRNVMIDKEGPDSRTNKMAYIKQV